MNQDLRPYLCKSTLIPPEQTPITSITSLKSLTPLTSLTPLSTDLVNYPRPRTYFTSKEIASIYGFPTPTANNVTVGVISLGGGLTGTVSNTGVLTGGDVQAYWTSLGFTSQPKVVIVPVGASNIPDSSDATIENTIDVETIGACCPTNKLTILVYFAPNTFAGFKNAFNQAINGTTSIGGTTYANPNIISCSWGTPEINVPESFVRGSGSIDALFAQAVAKNISICCASGDNGSNNGVGGTGNYVDFPSCSPNVVACGGTKLICPDFVYNHSTIETSWANSGGGFSTKFSKPSYQANISALTTKTMRSTPDIALNADPNTGVIFIINGNRSIIGGTSIVAPAIAGYLAALGVTKYFANNWIYKFTNTCYYDITSGNNGAYQAITGYDNCTGFGSINGCSANLQLIPIPVTSITVPNTSESNPYLINKNDVPTKFFTANVVPANATIKTLTYKSSNTAIATVNSSTGIITITGTIGRATITVSSTQKLFPTVSSYFYINVVAIGGRLVEDPNTIKSISVPKTMFLINKTTSQINATLVPSTAKAQTLTYSSSKPAVATVSSSGLITTFSKGTTDITVSAVQPSKPTVSATIRLSTTFV
jgi:kumamolisin